MSESKYWELNDVNPDAIIFEEFTEAYLGYGTRIGFKTPVAVYDARKMVKILAESFVSDPNFVDKEDVNSREALEEEAIEQAVEYVEFNYIGASFEENTPIFLYTYLL